MFKSLLTLLLVFPAITFAQKGVTIKVEQLEKPTSLIKLTATERIYHEMMMTDADLSAFEVDKNKITLPYNIIARSKGADSLVNFSYHPLFSGMYQAYADHRPFVLSPDIMWLLISQGFARHINSDPEKYRKYFTNQAGKVKLVVKNQGILLDDPNSPWEKAFPKFTSQLDAFAGRELSKVATANFSTTTSVSRAASQLTLMEAVKPYFAFVMIYIKCGIPEITLEGTPKDWQMVLDKTRYLKKYELSWWIDELEPLLKEFVKASNGNANKDFWRNMFKYHTLKEYGAPKVIDGWIVKFFPYTKTGKRNTLKSLSGTDGLPSEMVKVDLDFLTVSKEGTETTPLEMWAGFTGLEQNSKTFALKPAIGWMIRKKDSENDKRLAERIKKNYEDDPYFGINIQVQTVPKEILELKEIKKLTISFIDKINIPDEMGKMKIEGFAMDGSIDEAGIKRICKLLPNTRLWINNKIYNE
ncbi:MAG: DUF4419 domain-containing protein [Pedobacter sp.]|nr:DUF4419 domain-containing protein [Pedobacter sp.]